MIRQTALFGLAFAAPAAAGAQAPAAAPKVTAEQAIDVQHRRLQTATGTAPCPSEPSPDQILVCGRRGPDPNRVPFPDERVPGERVALLPGEPPSGAAALSATAQSRCSNVGRDMHCSAGVPVIGVLTTLFEIGKHLFGGDD